MAERVFLATDLGAESGRVMAGRFDGRRALLDEVHRFPNGPVTLAGTWRWDVLRLWSEVKTGLAAAAGRFGPAVASVGVSTWGLDYVLLSKSGELLGQPYHYRDRRTDGVMERAAAVVPRSHMYTITGSQFLPVNTLYQLIACAERNPELLAHGRRLLLMPDFFHWCLCDSTAIEFTNATTTQCYNPAACGWATDLLAQFGLPTDLFGEVVQPGTRLGELRHEVRTETGLSAVPVVAPATHDTASAVAAVPTPNTGRSNWAYISSGTWSLVGVEVSNPVLTQQALQAGLTNEGGVDGTFRLLKNVMGLWLVQRCRMAFGTSADYESLTRQAADAIPLRSLIEPDDPRFLNPPDMLAAIEGFCRETGQPVPETPGQFVRCCLESLALKYRTVLRNLAAVTGVPIEVVHIVGGGSRNRLLNQLTADATGLPVVAGPVEATALGSVLVQARSLGELGTLADLRAVVRNSVELERFVPTGGDRWAEATTWYSWHTSL